MYVNGSYSREPFKWHCWTAQLHITLDVADRLRLKDHPWAKWRHLPVSLSFRVETYRLAEKRQTTVKQRFVGFHFSTCQISYLIETHSANLIKARSKDSREWHCQQQSRPKPPIFYEQRLDCKTIPAHIFWDLKHLHDGSLGSIFS